MTIHLPTTDLPAVALADFFTRSQRTTQDKLPVQLLQCGARP